MASRTCYSNHVTTVKLEKGARVGKKVSNKSSKALTGLPSWTFLTNHAHVMVCITKNPQVRLAEIALLVGIGERAVHSIVQDLVEAGYVLKTRIGRNNSYKVRLHQPLRHPLESAHQVAEVFGPLTKNLR
jgi:DNA-binding transcriptional regulator PaaX